MKGLLLSLTITGFSFANLCGQVNLKEHLPFMPERVRIVEKREVMGLCEIILKDGTNVFPVYAGKDFVVAGTMFSKGQNISLNGLSLAKEKAIKEALPKLQKVVVAKEGTSEKTLYMISDPDCPYCEGSKKRVYELAKRQGWSVALIWFPLPHHQKAKDKVISFICEKRTFKDYLEGLYGNSKCEEGLRKVQEAMEVVEELGIGGTPTFILSTGRIVEGANLKALEEELR